jgi:hypothetical protein
VANAISKTDYYDFLIDIVEESCKNKLHLCANYHLEPMSLLNQQYFFQNSQADEDINKIVKNEENETAPKK